MQVTDISLIDVFKKYGGRTDSDFSSTGKNRYEALCHKHNDHNASLNLYDKTGEGQGWDYHCFTCKAHGNSIDLCIELGAAATEDDARKILMKDFGLALPDKVTVAAFTDLKGIQQDVAVANGWTDIEQGVLIPYYSQENAIIAKKVRCKYQGKDKYFYLKEDGLVSTAPYGLNWLDDYTDAMLYITEGETDAITLRQAGFPALGIPSCNAWSEAFAPTIARFDRIVVARDNDPAGLALVKALAADFPTKLYIKSPYGKVKDVNDLHVYKCGRDIDKFRKVFGDLTEYPATMNTFLTMAALDTAILFDPEAWKNVSWQITNPMIEADFIEKLVKATKFGRKEIKSMLHNNRVTVSQGHGTSEAEQDGIYESDSCYYKHATVQGVPIQKRLTNFVARPQYSVETEEGEIRTVTLVNQQGEVSKPVQFYPEDLVNMQKFQEKCVSAGKYTFSGSFEDARDIFNLIIEKTDRKIYSPMQIGLLDTGVWLFGNCGVDKDGSIKPVKEGMVELDGRIYAPKSLAADDDTPDTLPSYHYEARAGIPADYPTRIASCLRKSFGTYGTWLGLGWAVAGYYSNAIHRRFGYYPILFISGKRNSGKSTLAGLLQSSFGCRPETSGLSIETPSPVSVIRTLGYRSSLPVWYDDYRNDNKRIQAKDGLLLDVYNRHGAAKGIANSRSIREEDIRGYLLLSGEDTPANNALLTRVVQVQVSQYDRDTDTSRDQETYKELQGLFGDITSLSIGWCAGSQSKDNRAALLDRIAETKSVMERSGFDARISGNYAIFAASFLFAFEKYITEAECNDFMNWLIAHADSEKRDIESEHPVSTFLFDLAATEKQGYTVRSKDFWVKDHVMWFKLREIHDAWCRYRNMVAQGNGALKLHTLKNYLVKEPFFLPEQQKTFGTERPRCCGIDLTKLGDEYANMKAAIDRAEEF